VGNSYENLSRGHNKLLREIISEQTWEDLNTRPWRQANSYGITAEFIGGTVTLLLLSNCKSAMPGGKFSSCDTGRHTDLASHKAKTTALSLTAEK